MASSKKLGVCAQVWKELDRIQKRKPVPSLGDIMRVSSRRNWNENNTRIEYYAWRRAHGIHGRQTEAVARAN
jgi:hypothetical protein